MQQPDVEVAYTVAQALSVQNTRFCIHFNSQRSLKGSSRFLFVSNDALSKLLAGGSSAL